MTELKFTLPWPPTVNSYWAHGLIGAKRNLEEAFVEALAGLAQQEKITAIAEVIAYAKASATTLRAMVKAAFGSPRASVFLSQAGKDYRVAALDALDDQHVPRRALHGLLAVSAIAFPPDNRTRDVDNLWKGMLDALKHGNVIQDDGHIDDLHIRRGPIRPGGVVEFTVREIAEAFESRPMDLFATHAN